MMEIHPDSTIGGENSSASRGVFEDSQETKTARKPQQKKVPEGQELVFGDKLVTGE